MTTEQLNFIVNTYSAARKSGHIWPLFAACEATLESWLGKENKPSQLALEGNNLFGMKQHSHKVFGDLVLPTHEVLDGKWIATTADFVKYPDVQSCFADRMSTLERLAVIYPHYKEALCAINGYDFVLEVSKTWSTDPRRGEHVLAIYDDFCNHNLGASNAR